MAAKNTACRPATKANTVRHRVAVHQVADHELRERCDREHQRRIAADRGRGSGQLAEPFVEDLRK